MFYPTVKTQVFVLIHSEHEQAKYSFMNKMIHIYVSKHIVYQ